MKHFNIQTPCFFKKNKIKYSPQEGSITVKLTQVSCYLHLHCLVLLLSQRPLVTVNNVEALLS